MICHTKRTRWCDGCGTTRKATRRIHDREFRAYLWICDDCPSPDEIRDCAKRIGANWSQAERMKREVGRELGTRTTCYEEERRVELLQYRVLRAGDNPILEQLEA